MLYLFIKQIQRVTDGKEWYWYVDSTVTLDLLKQLTDEFLEVINKCPSRLKKLVNSGGATAANSGESSRNNSGRSSSQPSTSSRSHDSLQNKQGMYFFGIIPSFKHVLLHKIDHLKLLLFFLHLYKTLKFHFQGVRQIL